MKPKCPECGKKKYVDETTIPVVFPNGKSEEAPAFLCENCALLFVIGEKPKKKETK